MSPLPTRVMKLPNSRNAPIPWLRWIRHRRYEVVATCQNLSIISEDRVDSRTRYWKVRVLQPCSHDELCLSAQASRKGDEKKATLQSSLCRGRNEGIAASEDPAVRIRRKGPRVGATNVTIRGNQDIRWIRGKRWEIVSMGWRVRIVQSGTGVLPPTNR